MKKILLSEIISLKNTGAYRLDGWTRKQNNRIDQQSQRWLQGKEYFFSSYTQREKKDARELKRRANQDSVRQHHAEAISSFLSQYRHAADVIRDEFIPNYTTMRYDDFQLENTMQRLFRYGLIEKDVECEEYAKLNFSKKVNPTTYWKNLVDQLNSSNIQDALLNPITLNLAPELKLYKKIDKTFTRWYIDRVFSRTITDTSHVFGACEFLQKSSDEDVCQKVFQDFQQKSKSFEYQYLFQRLRITQELIQQSVDASLNKEGREREFEEWARRSGAYQRFQDVLNRKSFFQDAYTILGVQRNSSHSEIKSAYRRLCFSHHPDRGGDAERFIEINAAYEQIRRTTA